MLILAAIERLCPSGAAGARPVDLEIGHVAGGPEYEQRQRQRDDGATDEDLVAGQGLSHVRRARSRHGSSIDSNTTNQFSLARP